MALPVVTPENYYSPEMNMAYMGSTQFKAFERCEAAALAELKGEYRPPSSAALLVGGYIDAWFSGELPLYQAQHPEIFKRDGTLKAEYVKATEVVARLQADDLYSLLMSGKKQVIRTGTIAGVPFKIKIDSLLDADTCAKIVAEFPNAAAALGLCDGAIVDQKAMASMESVWSAEDHCKVPFIEYYKIDRLSDLAGHDVVFKLKALPYGKVHDIERFTQDTEVHILLAGCVEPNLKDERLLEKFGGATPADAVKKMLLAGEITDLAQVIERLSGYRRLTITEVKNV